MQKILLIEDDVHLQSMLMALFARQGMEADAVFDGEEALSALESGGYSLLVTDVNLPDMMGSELVSQIREGGTSLPIVVITGGERGRESRDEVQAELEALGISGFFVKPFDHAALIERVKEELSTL